MTLEEIIRSRRTYHQFTGDAVPQEVINKSLELAMWAPNHKLTYPWVFYDLGPESRKKMIELAVDLKKQKTPDLSTAMELALKEKLGSASHMLMIGLKQCESEFQQREDYATVSCGIQNMSLFLHDQGFGSKWSTGGFTSHKRTYETLGVDPQVVEIVGCLLVGCIDSHQTVRIPQRPNPTDLIHCRP